MSDNFEIDAALALRDKQRSRVIADLEEFCEWLFPRLEKNIDNASLTELIRPGRFQKSKIKPEVEAAVQKRWARFLDDLKIETANDMANTSGEGEDSGSYLAHLALAAGGSLITAAPLAAMPLVASLAMATTTSFLVFTVPVISLPVVGAVTAGLVVVSLGGNQLRSWSIGKIRGSHKSKTIAQLRLQILGEGAKTDDVSMKSQLLAIVDEMAKARIALA